MKFLKMVSNIYFYDNPFIKVFFCGWKNIINWFFGKRTCPIFSNWIITWKNIIDSPVREWCFSSFFAVVFCNFFSLWALYDDKQAVFDMKMRLNDVIWSFLRNFVIVRGLILLLKSKSILYLPWKLVLIW